MSRLKVELLNNFKIEGNHNLMGKTAGFTVKSYRYYDAATKLVNFDGLKEDLEVILVPKLKRKL